MFARKDFSDPRDYDVLVTSPEHYKKYSNVRGSQSVQLNKIAPVRGKDISEEDKLLNKTIQKVLRPETGDQVHHKNALSLIGVALDKADDAGKAQIYNLLEHNGIDIGDDIYNLINLPTAVHEDHHRFTRDQGLEMQGKGTKGLAKRLLDSDDIDSTLEYLQDYIDYGIPMIRENIDDLLTRHYASKPKFSAERSELEQIPELREALLAVKSGRDTQASGLVAGEKPTVINAGEGSRVYVEAGNGNGNGSKAEKIKAILKNGNGRNGNGRY